MRRRWGALLLWLLIVTGAMPSCGRSDENASVAGSGWPGYERAIVDPTIRVLLKDQLAYCMIVPHGAVNLVDSKTGEILSDIANRKQLRIDFGEDHITIAESVLPVQMLDIVPRTNAPLELILPGQDGRRFRGTLRLIHQSAFAGAVVNLIDVETYLVGVVSAELPAGFHRATFRAQAIAARTYAWYRKQTGRAPREWDVTGTESSQVYVGLAREKVVPEAAEAVRETRGLVCTWSAPEGERIFCTYYCSVCGGRTQSVRAIRNDMKISPLAGDVRCDYCKGAPGYHWGPITLMKTEVTKMLRARYPRFEEIGLIDEIEVDERTPGGRPIRLTLRDEDGEAIPLGAENFRLAVDPTGRRIQSTLFTLEVRDSAFVLSKGRGFGHGVGMCQYGAEGQARAGKSAAEILRFYYPDSHLTRVY